MNTRTVDFEKLMDLAEKALDERIQVIVADLRDPDNLVQELADAIRLASKGTVELVWANDGSDLLILGILPHQYAARILDKPNKA